MLGFRVGESCCHFFSSSPVLGWVTSRWKYYVQFCRSAIFVSGLAITHKFVNYVVVNVLITFIKDNSNEKLVGSTALTNMGDAISGLTRILMTAISTSFACHQKVIFYSTSLYIMGLILLSLIAYEKIGKRISYMIVGLVLIQVGKAGSKPILNNFFRQQLCSHETEGEEDHERVGARFKAWTLAAWLLALIPIILTADSGWEKTLLVSSSMLAVSCACFLCGSSMYHRVDPITCPLTVVFRVLTAAILKRNAPYPTSFNKFFHNNSLKEDKIFSRLNDRIYVLPYVHFCGWMDKAAIKESSMEEQGRKRRTAREVQETKHILRMVPIWVVFFGFGVARATWNTLFVEQADYYGPDSITTPLLVISTVSEVSISHLYDWIAGWMPDTQKRYYFLKLRIWLGMLMCTACFTVAWKIQGQDGVPKSEWLLVPQFCLSGFAEGLGMGGLAEFYDYQVPPSMRGYGDEFNGLVTSSGSLLAIIFLFTSTRNWFGDDLKSSYLYKYYIFITLITITSLLVGSYVLLASYAYNSDMTDDPTGHLKSEAGITKDESENEARLHGEAVQIIDVDHKNDAP